MAIFVFARLTKFVPDAKAYSLLYADRGLDTTYGHVLEISGVAVFEINNKNHLQWAKIAFKKRRM